VPLDADQIARLYRAHARALVAYFARRTFDAHAATELMAETFAAVVADRRAFRGAGEDDAAAWLYGIARHQLSGWYRSAQVERRKLAKIGLEPPGLTDAEYERIEELSGLATLRGDVAARLAELPPDHREALRLRVVEERGYPEVASALGIAEPAARARVSRALRALASALGGEDARGEQARGTEARHLRAAPEGGRGRV
jgi:RNA polymerase sigma-70 factor (ECF subfamily)